MRHSIHSVPLFAVVLIGTLVGCPTGAALQDGKCPPDLCVRLELQHPIRMGEPVPVTITVQANHAIPAVDVTLSPYGEGASVQGDRQWKVDLLPDRPVVLFSAVKFSQEGLFDVIASVHDPVRGMVRTDHQRLRVTRGGATVNPPSERTPGQPVLVKDTLAVVPPTVTLTPPPPIPTPSRPPYPPASLLVAPTATLDLSPEAICGPWFSIRLDARVPLEKRSVEQAAYDECVEARRSTSSPSARLTAVRPAPKNSPRPTAPPWIAPSDVPHRPLGDGTVLEEGSSMFPSHYLIENQWWETVGSQWVRVFAGAQRGDGAVDLPKPWQGMIFVSVAGLDGTPLPGGGAFKTPEKAGSVKIVDAQGERLVLRAEDGSTFYFDLPSRRFVSSLMEVVPTITPLPTPTTRTYPGP